MQSGMVVAAGILVYYFRGYEKAHQFHDVQSPDVLSYLKLLKIPVSALNLGNFIWSAWLRGFC